MIASLLLHGLFALSLPSFSSQPTQSYNLALHAKPGTVLEKSFSTETEMASDGFTVEMNGSPVPTAFLPAIEIESLDSTRVVVRDHYRAVEGGRATSLIREYEALGGSGEFSFQMGDQGAEPSDWESSHDLEGTRVAFEWDAEEESYTREALEQKEQPESLDSLDAALDLTEFLPEGEVAPGDDWTVDGAILRRFLAPGGELELAASPGYSLDWELGELSGDLSVVFKKVRSDEDINVAVLAIEGNYMQVKQRATDLSQVPVADGTATETFTTEIEVEGVLLWDIDAGHAISLELEGELDAISRTVKDPDQPGGDYSSDMLFVGSIMIGAEFSDVTE